MLNVSFVTITKLIVELDSIAYSFERDIMNDDLVISYKMCINEASKQLVLIQVKYEDDILNDNALSLSLKELIGYLVKNLMLTLRTLPVTS